eukprot:scaffold20228_cov117-Isochrysis_galbana.AAC.1
MVFLAFLARSLQEFLRSGLAAACPNVEPRRQECGSPSGRDRRGLGLPVKCEVQFLLEGLILGVPPLTACQRCLGFLCTSLFCTNGLIPTHPKRRPGCSV